MLAVLADAGDVWAVPFLPPAPVLAVLRPLLVLALVLLAAAPAAAPLAAQEAPPAPRLAVAPARFGDVVEAARRDAAAYLSADGLPGVAFGVAVDGRVVWAEGFGYADLEQRVPVWPATRFRIASISKPLAAVGAALLVDEGRLDVDAPVQDYVAYFPAKRWPVTTRQVGGHLGGIRHYRGDEYFIRDPYPSVEAAVGIFGADTLLHAPGSAYAYSSYGWNLVSAVIEGAAGEAFLPYMRRRVFEPLGMHATVADHADSLIVQRARPYVRDEAGRLVNAPFVDNSYKWAGGGFLSTVEDLLRFGDAMLGSALVGPDGRALLFTEQSTTAGEGTGYGFGWGIGTDAGGQAFYEHTGGAVGGTSLLLVHPPTRTVFVVLINLSGADLGPARAIGQRFIEAAAAAEPSQR